MSTLLNSDALVPVASSVVDMRRPEAARGTCMIPVKAADEADEGTMPNTPFALVFDAEEEGAKAPTPEAKRRKEARTDANFMIVFYFFPRMRNYGQTLIVMI